MKFEINYYKKCSDFQGQNWGIFSPPPEWNKNQILKLSIKMLNIKIKNIRYN